MAMSGQITVTTAGTPVQGADNSSQNPLYVLVKAHPDNSDTVWVGNNGSGSVSATTGYPLNPGEWTLLQGNLNRYWFDADANSSKICWMITERHNA